MKKTIRVFSMIAIILAGLCVLALLVCICAQRPLLMVYSQMPEVLGNFYIPAGAIVYALSVVLAAALLVAGVNMGGGVMEVFSTVAIVLAPGMQTLITTLQTTMVGRMKGVNYLAGLSAMNSLGATFAGIGRVAAVLIVLTCGMSIAYKRIKKTGLN